jgi:hypothetical protein
MTSHEWHTFLHSATQFDIDRGGFADPRVGCINFWVGPNNKPEGYEWPITKAVLNYSRNYLGTVSPRWDEEIENVTAWWVSSVKYEALDVVGAPLEQLRAAENRPEHIAWVQREFSRLHWAILGREVDVPFVVGDPV